MFRWSLRELMLVMLATSMSLAWVVEHKRVEAMKIDLLIANGKVEDAENDAKRHDRVVSGIEAGLKKRGLQLESVCRSDPMVAEIPPR